MKLWQETSAIYARLETLVAEGKQAAVALVVRIQGSAYRRPGAKLLVEEDGTTLGGVSGGCLEADVRQVALEVMGKSVPRSLHYETGSEEDLIWGLGLGCNGTVDLFVEAATQARYLGMVRVVGRLLDGNEAFAVTTIIEGRHAGVCLVVKSDGIIAHCTGETEAGPALVASCVEHLDRGRPGLHSVDGVEVFTEVQRPPPFLLVIGAGDDAIPLVRYASEAGFRVLVVDHRPAHLAVDRFPSARGCLCTEPQAEDLELPLGSQTYTVVKTHELSRDRRWVERLLAAEVAYVGLLGPQERRDRILQQVSVTDDRQRVYGPVGLDVGAEGPEQVGLSVVAELLAVFSGRQPRHLRERRGAIHVAD
ncbi:MAG: XdhC family protein [Acidobacteriota bacterium]